MKKIFFIGIFALCIFVLKAQPGRQRMTVEERAKKITEWMTKELNLTEDQIQPIDSINLLFTKAQQILFQSAEGDRDKIREAMGALEKEKEGALEKVLTEDQLDTYKEKTREMEQNRKRNRNR
jgi:hypothetical protein